MPHRPQAFALDAAFAQLPDHRPHVIPCYPGIGHNVVDRAHRIDRIEGSLNLAPAQLPGFEKILRLRVGRQPHLHDLGLMALSGFGYLLGDPIQIHLIPVDAVKNRLVPVDNSLIFINFMNRLRAKRTDSLTNRFFLLSIRPV